MMKTDELIDEFYAISKQDAKASLLLFKKKLYPQSIFFLQQSIEKCGKCLDIRFKNLSPDDLQKYSHKPSKIKNELLEDQLKKAVRVRGELANLVDLDSVPELDSNLSAALEMYEGAVSSFGELDKIELSEELFNALERDIDLIEEDVEVAEFPDNLGKAIFSEPLFVELMSVLGNEHNEQLKSLEDALNEQGPAIKRGLIRSVGPMKAQAVATLLQKITEQHAVSSRYPLVKSGKCPTKVYIESHELVVFFPRIHKLLISLLHMTQQIIEAENE